MWHSEHHGPHGPDATWWTDHPAPTSPYNQNPDSDFDSSPFGGGPFGAQNAPFDVSRASNLRRIHGVPAAIAFVLLFPLGSILIRVVPGRAALMAHRAMQMLAFAIFVAAAGLGIYLTTIVQFGDVTLFDIEPVNAHLIIGLFVLGALFFQPALGYIHHEKFKSTKGRTVWSYLHLWNGRLGITLGIVNGGLGLWVAGASRTLKIAYGVVAGVVWLIWIAVSVLSTVTSGKGTRRRKLGERRV